MAACADLYVRAEPEFAIGHLPLAICHWLSAISSATTQHRLLPALTARPSLLTLGHVMGISRQAAERLSGAWGWRCGTAARSGHRPRLCPWANTAAGATRSVLPIAAPQLSSLGGQTPTNQPKPHSVSPSHAGYQARSSPCRAADRGREPIFMNNPGQLVLSPSVGLN